ncbi:MAG: RagB/SusD family nutrient uptake outer membrane protein [Rikenellaceae bacterium]
MKAKKFINIALLLSVVTFSSCNAFLDREPLDDIPPEQFFNTDSEVQSYVVSRYTDVFSTFGGYNITKLRADDHTDNQASSTASNANWATGYWQVPQSGSGWVFTVPRKINYFLAQVESKFEAGQISGDQTNISHSIGEAYFIRAYENFEKLVKFGDFPIITEVMVDELESLIEYSKRAPRNMFARFIISDLEKAISMMTDTPNGGTNRITRKTALLFKSRVALFEGTWLKYHKGTARVPGTEDWPGKDKDYNKDFTIDIDAEIEYFLAEAMKASKEVAENVTLTVNSGKTNPDYQLDNSGFQVSEVSGVDWNPYFEMFSDVDMNDYSEVLFWRAYNGTMSASSLHSVSSYLYKGGSTGLTRSSIDTYLMANGLPHYHALSGYKGDNTLEDVQQGRDPRLPLFMSIPTDVARFENPDGIKFTLFGAPTILSAEGSKMTTGYNSRKFYTYDIDQIGKGNGLINTYGCLLFRAVEAHLNYMEACYELNGSLDADALEYWTMIRERAGVDPDVQMTVDATDLTKENDWAVYSSGKMIDPYLYNIRRERRIELMQEGYRWNDLKRWASLETVKDYIVEGFNLWGDNAALYDVDGKTTLIYEGQSGVANVSPKENSTYLRPYQIVSNNNNVYNGYNWHVANYLSPLPFEEIQLVSTDYSDLSTSVLYQNPGWPYEAGGVAIDY